MSELDYYINKLKTPATKDDLMDVAKKHNAEQHILDMIDKMPDGTFMTPQSLDVAYRETEDKEES